MTDYQKYINALRKCAKEHDNDITYTGHIIVSDLCRDTANLLESLEQEPKTIQEIQAESEKYQKAFEDGYEQGYAQARFDYEQEPCEDAISRQEVLNQIFYSTDNSGDVVLGSVLRRRIENLPSVRPQEPKTGHWIEKDGYDGDTYYDCSECGESWTTIEGTPWNNGMKYCPNCGAKMESEDRE